MQLFAFHIIVLYPLKESRISIKNKQNVKTIVSLNNEVQLF